MCVGAQVAYRLYKISLAAGKDCIQYFAVDGEEKKVTQGQGELLASPESTSLYLTALLLT